MIELTDIAYVRSGVADLDAAVAFATRVVGLELAAPTELGVAHLRADSRHHCLALVGGRSGVIASGFTVADLDALAAAETELERAGHAVRRGSPEEARSRSPAPRGSPSSDTCAWTRPTCARPTGSGAPGSTRGCRTGSAARPA